MEIGLYCHNVVFLACDGGTKTRNCSRICSTSEANMEDNCVLEDQPTSHLEIVPHLAGSKGRLIMTAYMPTLERLKAVEGLGFATRMARTYLKVPPIFHIFLS
jgi:hypothetical protein